MKRTVRDTTIVIEYKAQSLRKLDRPTINGFRFCPESRWDNTEFAQWKR